MNMDNEHNHPRDAMSMDGHPAQPGGTATGALHRDHGAKMSGIHSAAASMMGHAHSGAAQPTIVLSGGQSEAVVFDAGMEVVEGFSLGDDILELKNTGVQDFGGAPVRLSDANDFVGFVSMATASDSDTSPVNVSIAGDAEHADLVIAFLNSEGEITDTVTLLGAASDIGVAILELAGATIQSDGHAHQHSGSTTQVSENIDEFATHVAVNDGDWSDPATWENGEVPGEGAIVHIPADVTVSYGENAGDAHVFYIHVDGGFEMSSDQGVSRLTVDTIFTTPGSNLEADASSGNLLDIVIKPFDVNQIEGLTDHARYDADGRIVGDGAGVLGRYDWDPAQLSLGIVTEGSVKITGQNKTEHLELEMTASRGDATITLDLAPLGLEAGARRAEILEAVGWAEGDLITIGSSEFRSRDDVRAGNNQLTEEREVTDLRIVDGKLEVTLDRALDHDHTVKNLDTDLDGTADTRISPSVANLSKALQIRSDVTTETNDDGFVIGVETNLNLRTITQQGHTMFMHNTDVQIEDVAFAGMGRSNKGFLLDDKILDRNEDTQLISPIGDADSQDITNMRGRYAVHLHQSGFEDSGDKDAEDAFDYGGAHVSGNLVWGSPGWGFAHHGGLATLTDNVAYEVFGSGFVSETGDEQGVWANNLSLLSGAGVARGAEEVRSPNQDFGATGVGFWLESRMIEVVYNKAQDLAGSGFFIDGAGGSSKTIAVEDLPEWLLPYADALDRAGGYDGQIHARDIPLMRFADNISIGTNHGVWFEDGVQEVQFTFGRIEREGGVVEHDLLSLIQDHTASEVGRAGLFTRNTSQVTVDGLVTSGTIASNSLKQAFGGAAYRESTEVTFFDSYLDDFRKGEPTGPGLGGSRYFSQDIIQNGLTGALDLSVVKVTVDEETLALYPDPRKQGLDAAFGESDNYVYHTTRNIDGSPTGFASTPQITDFEGDIYTPDRFTTILGTKSDVVAYTPQSPNFARLNDELIKKIRVTDETYVFETSEVAAGSADPGAYVTGVWGVKIDSIGASYAPFTDQRDEGVDIEGVGEELAMALTVSDLEYLIARRGVIEVGGDRFLLMQEAFSDRVSTEVQTVQYAIKLNGSHWDQFETTARFDTLEFGLAKDDVGEVSFSLAGRAYTEHETFGGTDGADAIFAQFGDDTLRGGGGDDLLHGGAGDDTIRGGAGDDTLVAGSGRDDLNGGTGKDVAVFTGSVVNYSVKYEESGVLIVTDRVGNNGVNRLDRVETLRFDDLVVNLPEDYDILLLLGFDGPAPAEPETNTGTADPVERGADSGTPDDDADHGGDGDQVVGDDDDGMLTGSSGNDGLEGDLGNNVIKGGRGDDTLAGQRGEDTLRANGGDDVVSGGLGDDVMSGGKGNDKMFGNAGDDILKGGDGNDSVWGGKGDDQVLGGDGDDMLIGKSGKDRLEGDLGNDVIKGGRGDDTLAGQQGEDTLRANHGDDVVSGGLGDDVMSGGKGDDKMFGNAGDDILKGGDGNDSLFGGAGDDILIGGVGDNVLTGGDGADIFRLNGTASTNSIIDFVDGEDRIRIDGVQFDRIEITQDGHKAVVRADEVIVTLDDVNSTDITRADFIL